MKKKKKSRLRKKAVTSWLTSYETEADIDWKAVTSWLTSYETENSGYWNGTANVWSYHRPKVRTVTEFGLTAESQHNNMVTAFDCDSPLDAHNGQRITIDRV